MRVDADEVLCQRREEPVDVNLVGGALALCQEFGCVVKDFKSTEVLFDLEEPGVGVLIVYGSILTDGRGATDELTEQGDEHDFVVVGEPQHGLEPVDSTDAQLEVDGGELALTEHVRNGERAEGGVRGAANVGEDGLDGRFALE